MHMYVHVQDTSAATSTTGEWELSGAGVVGDQYLVLLLLPCEEEIIALSSALRNYCEYTIVYMCPSLSFWIFSYDKL